MRLSKSAVDALPSPPSGYRLFWDDALRGFGAMVSAAGVKTWVVRFRVGGRGVDRRMKLGRCNVLTVDEARLLARAALGAAARGEDPRRPRAAGLTLEALVARWAEDAALRTKTARVRARSAMRAVPPALAARPLAEVSADDARALHASLRRTPYAANRALETLRGAWNWGAERVLAPEQNPFARVRRYPERRRERFLSLEELARLFAALADAEEEAERPADRAVVRALRLLALTGCRRGEIARLRWRDVDLARRLLLLPESKTGARAVPLGPLAAAELARLRAEPEVDEAGWVFPGRAPGRPVAELKGAWRAVRRRAEIRDCRIHDLRHTYASLLAGGGASLPVIGAVLGHAQASTTQRYAHLADDPVRRALEAADAALAAALGERASAEDFSRKPEEKA